MGRFPEKLEQLKLSRTNYFAGGAAASLRHMGTGSQPSLWEKVPQLAMPTLLLTGALDNTFHDIAASMKERNSRIIARSLPNCGHNCHWENPRLFAAVVDEFLETKKVSIV
jgi:2-succinyl-6-hydroxy-2,4-cyclohexadiene-1-carboxylate synthase